MDVLDAPSAIHSLWNALPGVVPKSPRSPAAQFRPAFRSNSVHEEGADPLNGFVVRGFSGLIYNEQAFQYLLEIERRRAESTQRPFLLMLIDCGEAARGQLSGGAVTPERLFPIVCRTVRETDFVGWYRQGAILGATLTQDRQDSSSGTKHAGRIVRDRITQALGHGLPSEHVSQLRLRLYEVQSHDQLRLE
jgi:hypothetical protein